MKTLRLNHDLELTSNGAVFFEDNNKYVVIGDLHLGLERYMRQQGVFIAKKQLKEVKLTISSLIKYYGKDIVIVINGDVKHDFGKYSYEDKKEIKNLLTFISERTHEVKVIKGNHDNYLVSIAEYLGIEVTDFFETDNFFIFHGDEDISFPSNKHTIIHHFHPSLTLQDDVGAKIKVRCFLVGKQQAYRILAPALSHYSPGMNVLQWEERKIMDLDLDDYAVYAIDDENIYDFGKLRILRESLKHI